MADDQFEGLDDAVNTVTNGPAPTTPTAVRNNLQFAVNANPDNEAFVQHLARFTDTPTETVRNDTDTVKTQAALQSVDADHLVTNYPKTAGVLGDLDNARKLHDDIPTTAAIEHTVRSIQPQSTSLADYLFSSKGYGANNLLTDVGGLGYSMLQGLGGSFSQAEKALNLALAPVPMAIDKAFGTDYADQWFRNMVQPADTNAAIFAPAPGANIATRASHAVGGMLGLLSQITTTGGGGEAAAIPQTATGLEAAGASVIHAIKSMAFPSATSGVNTAQQVYAETGDPLAAARAGLTQYGVSTEQGILPLSAPGSLFTRMAQGAVSFPITAELGRQQMNAVLPGTMRQQFNPEDIAINSLLGLTMAAVHGQPLAPTAELTAAAREIYATAARADAAQKASQMVQALSELSAQSKFRERDAEQFRNFVADIADTAGSPDLYVNGKDFAQALDQSGIKADELQTLMPDLAGQMREALMTEGQVKIPLEDYATKIAGSKIDEALQPHLRTDPDGMSFSEAQDYYQTEAERFKATAENVIGERAQDQTFQDSGQQVEDYIRGELDKTGRFPMDVNKSYASMWRAFFDTTAARTGQLPHELLDTYKAQVRSEHLPEAGEQELEQKPVAPATIEGTQAQGEQGGPAGRRPGTDRPGLPADEDGHTTVGGGRAAEGWTGATRIRRAGGEPATVYRGAASELSADHFAPEALGQASGNPSSGLGVWFTVSSPEAARYGDVSDYHLDLRNPKVIRAENLPGFDTVEEAHAFREKLREQGYDGIAVDARHLGGAVHFVAFDPEQVIYPRPSTEGLTLEQKSRGQISFATDIASYPSTISLFKNADLSTFLHESGHFFLEVYSDLAKTAGMDTPIGQDFQKLMDWFGIKDAASWRDMSLADKREFHEQFARGFERYLMEGKAPTIELQTVFGRFRSWLMQVYRSLSSLNVELTPEVRGVMDRMLASDEAIKQTEQARGMLPLFDAKPEGMTEDAWQKYQTEQRQATEQAVSDLQSKSIRDMQWISNLKLKATKALQREAREARADMREQVEKEVSREPIEQAKRWLKMGELTRDDGTEVKAEKGSKLDTDVVKAMFPETLDKPDLTKLRGMTSAEGLHPDLVAEMFGMPSGDALVRELVAGESTKSKIEGLTDQRMLEQHGELVDQRSIERAAEAAIHNEVRARVLARELNALAKATGSARLLAQAAGEAAQAAIGAKRIRDISPRQYEVAEGKTGKAAMDAMKKGDTETAAIQKRAQLLNNRLAKEAANAQDQVRKILAYMKRFERMSTLKNIAPEERDQILQLLGNYDFRRNPTLEPNRAQRNLQQWLESQQMAGYTPAVDQRSLTPTPRTQYRDMTYEALTGLYDTVRSIEQIGKEKTRADWQGQRVSLDDLIKNTFVPRMQERGDNFSASALYDRPENRGLNPVQHVLDRMGSTIRALFASLKPQYFKANHFDQHEILGPFHELFNQVFEANYRKIELTKAQSDFARELAGRLGRDWQNTLFDMVPNTTLMDAKASAESNTAVPMRLTRDNLIQMAAHAGNESNFDKLAKGYGWAPDSVWRFLDGKLSARDAEAVKAEWEMANQHWDQVKAMYERMGQVAPPKIEPRPYKLRLSDGDTVDMPGGYMPIRYDPLRSRLGEKQQAERIIDPESGRFGYDFFGRDTTTNGSMNARVDGYTDAIDLSHNAFERALRETIHDLAYREPLVNFNKIITHPEFRTQFLKTYGREEYDALHEWLGRIANAENMDRTSGALGTMLRYMRSGMVMNAIALRISTVLKHGGSAGLKTLGYFAGGGEKYYLARQAALTYNYKAEMQEALEKFPEIRARALQQDRDYRETVSSLFKPDSLQGKAERFGHAAVAWADLFTAVATAHGAYDRAVTEGIPESIGGTGKPMTPEQAVRYANQIVREAHGSQLEASRSNIMTNPNEAVKMFTTIYGFMNNTFGQAADTASKLGTAGISNPQVLARAFMSLIVPAMWAGVLTEGVPTKDDWKKWAAKSMLSEAIGMIPFGRDVYAFASGYANAGQVAPESFIHTIVQPFMDIAKVAQGKPAPGAITHAADALGMGLHIPGLGQIGKSLQYVYDVKTGKKSAPKNALEAAQGLTVGVKTHH